MKTDKFYKEYLEANKKVEEELKTLEEKRQEIVTELSSVEQEYGLATNQGEFEKAQEVYVEVTKLKEQLKERESIIKIKKDTMPAIKRKNLFELLNKVNDLRSFYQEEAEGLKERLNNTIEEYNAVIEEVKELNTLYNMDLSKYDNLHYFLPYNEKHLFKKQHGDWKAKTRNMINHKDELDKVEISKY